MNESDDEATAHPDNVSDISPDIQLQDAHFYDSVTYPTILQGQIRPFFAHKSSCYIGQYSHFSEDVGEPVTEPAVVKFWNSNSTGTDRSEACLEAQLLSESSHPNIIRIFGIMEWEGRLGVVTHLANHPLRTLDGLMLDVHTQRRSCHWTRGDTHDVLLGIAQGLAHIHSLNIVHRDVKPNNVLLLVDPATDRYIPAICDFGSAQHIAQLEERITGGALFFSPPHSTEVDPRLDDTYRFALVTWCVFTSQWPFEKEKVTMSELDFHRSLQVRYCWCFCVLSRWLSGLVLDRPSTAYP
jgi:serine/threonine protein kinase